MDNDERRLGRLLSRREIMLLAGGAGIALLSACATDAASDSERAPAPNTMSATSDSSAATTGSGNSGAFMAMPACIARPKQTEGPYFVDEKLNRSDIRSDPGTGAVKEGLPLTLSFSVGSVTGNACAPLAGATIDVWHCDALGLYSDVRDGSFNTIGQKFLRGYQVSDAGGRATFNTIYPGWYQGRTVHIHFKIRARGDDGRTYDFTSQLYFEDALSDDVFTHGPYSGKGRRATRNANDGIYRDGGDQLLLRPTKSGDGYLAGFEVGLKM
jgi:protocatechuate 3,4-dioxygenase beta subunit